MTVAREILLSFREGEQPLNFFTAERTVALRNVLLSLEERGSSEYELRKIFRWFSTTFRTPLADVYDLPLDFVLEHFYETKYEDMDADQRDEERKLLSESEEDRRQRELIEDRTDYDNRQFELEAEEIAKKQEEEAKKSEKGEKLVAPDLPTPNFPTMMPDMKTDPFAPPKTTKIPPNITMKFVSDEEMQKLINDADDDDEKMQIDARGNLPRNTSDQLPKMK
jgi:hypothetical protein